LLAESGGRPLGRRAAEQRDELAPSQLIKLHSIPPARARLQDNALAKINQAHLDILASARWPASVIRTWVTSVCRSLVPMRSVFTVASPALTRSSSIRVETRWARITALVHPFRLSASNSGAGGGSGWGRG